MHTKLTQKTKLAIALAAALPVLALGAGAAASLARQGPSYIAAEDSDPLLGVVTFTHHKNGWRLTAAPLPGLAGGFELRLRDLGPEEVKGTALDLPVTGAVLMANGAPLLSFQPLRGGDLYAVLPERVTTRLRRSLDLMRSLWSALGVGCGGEAVEDQVQSEFELVSGVVSGSERVEESVGVCGHLE